MDARAEDSELEELELGDGATDELANRLRTDKLKCSIAQIKIEHRRWQEDVTELRPLPPGDDVRVRVLQTADLTVVDRVDEPPFVHDREVRLRSQL